MRWKNYSYRIVPGGAEITQYLPQEEPEDGCLNLPDRIDGLPVVAIGEDVFSEHGGFLSVITVPATVERIGDRAFRMCMCLTELVLAEGLLEIGAEALCLTPLSSLRLPSTLQRLGQPWDLGSIRFFPSPENPVFFADDFCLYRRDADGQELLVCFHEEEKTAYAVADGTTRVGEQAFSGHTTLERVVLPDTVREIADSAFEDCQVLKELILPQGLVSIGENAFTRCLQLKELAFPASLRHLGESALADTYGWSETFNGPKRILVSPDNPLYLADEEAFFVRTPRGGRKIIKYFGTGLDYHIPEDVEEILPGAFRRATRLRRFFVPPGLKRVGEDAFKECKALAEVVFVQTNTVLYVPRQPVYRKDEVTNLFYSGVKKENEGKKSWEHLPKKWKDFAWVYAREPGEMAAFLPGGEGYADTGEKGIYDFVGYDALFHTYLKLPDHLGMACCRLTYPEKLLPSVKAGYEGFLREHFDEILLDIAERQDFDHLTALAGLGCFTRDNIEESIAVFSAAGRTKFTGFLLNYKREHLGEEEFSFDL